MPALMTVAVLGGCRRKQSLEDALRIACELPERPDIRARLKADPEHAAQYLAREISKRVTNPDAKQLFGAIGPDATARIQAAVRRAGIAHCWMTDPPPASNSASRDGMSHAPPR